MRLDGRKDIKPESQPGQFCIQTLKPRSYQLWRGIIKGILLTHTHKCTQKHTHTHTHTHTHRGSFSDISATYLHHIQHHISAFLQQILFSVKSITFRVPKIQLCSWELKGRQNSNKKMEKHCTKMKFSTKDFFSKCDRIRRKLWTWPHLLKKILLKNLILCVVTVLDFAFVCIALMFN